MNGLMRFREAMAQHLGQTLTPEIAARIESEAFHLDWAIDPEQFPREQHDGYWLGVESFREIQLQLHALHEAHWLETEKHRHGFALRPNYDALRTRERAGHLLQFTARMSEGPIAGQLRMFLGESLHTQTLMAEEDTLYVLPEHRTGTLGLALLRYAERCLVAGLGVREIRANSKVLNNADVLMRRMKYRHVANQFVKIFPPKEKADVL
jgi:hypothetical protein